MQTYTSPGRYRAITTLLFLAPGTPLLFHGQEFAASAPFLYFADHEEWLGKLIREGRAASLHQFRCLRAGDGTVLRRPGRRGNVRVLQARLEREGYATRKPGTCTAT